MPHYFKGYKTNVKFVSGKIIKQKTKKLYHAGEVFTFGGELGFCLKTKSNPHITAAVLMAYAKVAFDYYKTGKFGAYSILDVPIGHLLQDCKKFI